MNIGSYLGLLDAVTARPARVVYSSFVRVGDDPAGEATLPYRTLQAVSRQGGGSALGRQPASLAARASRRLGLFRCAGVAQLHSELLGEREAINVRPILTDLAIDHPVDI